MTFDPPPNTNINLAWTTVPDCARSALALYNRCVMLSEIALPEEGGVLDQNEMLMQLFEIIHHKVLEIREAKQKRENFRLNIQANRGKSIQSGKSVVQRQRF